VQGRTGKDKACPYDAISEGYPPGVMPNPVGAPLVGTLRVRDCRWSWAGTSLVPTELTFAMDGHVRAIALSSLTAAPSSTETPRL